MNNPTIHFHITRGGNFHNAGHKVFRGFKSFQKVLSEQDNHLFTYAEDDHTYCKDGSGQIVCHNADGETGVIDYDGAYDMHEVKYLEDCTDKELDLIANDKWACDFYGAMDYMKGRGYFLDEEE